jgi:hypothetical protein
MPNTRADITNVQVKRKTRDRLDKSGRRGETFDEIISRLLDERDGNNRNSKR